MPDRLSDTPLVLEVSSSQGHSARYDLTTSPLVIGRLAECDIQLDSQRVSRRHAELVREENDQWLIRDLASRNGTRVHGQSPLASELVGNLSIDRPGHLG